MLKALSKPKRFLLWTDVIPVPVRHLSLADISVCWPTLGRALICCRLQGCFLRNFRLINQPFPKGHQEHETVEHALSGVQTPVALKSLSSSGAIARQKPLRVRDRGENPLSALTIMIQLMARVEHFREVESRW